ncbi:MAG: response regulator [Verrucomicrobiales bacterium]|nr:response regulator [Verrucomicrobiales bacterium]
MKDERHAPTVLIVDDEEGLTRLVDQAMRRNGLSTAIAHSGEAAMAWLKDNSADLMLLDLKLSDLH